MNTPLVPRVFILTHTEDTHDGWFLTSEKAHHPLPELLALKGKLEADVLVEICPLEQSIYHTGPFTSGILWREGGEIQYTPRSIFFDDFGASLKRKTDSYDHCVFSALYDASGKFAGITRLAIMFPPETILGNGENHKIAHTILKAFVSDRQTPPSTFRGKTRQTSQIEEVYLIFPGTHHNVGITNSLWCALDDVLQAQS